MCQRRGILSGWNMFNALDTIHATATELDKIQTCFLGLGAPVFAKSLAQLLNLQLYPSLQFQLSGNRHLFSLFQDRPPARTSRLPPHKNHVCFITATVPLSYLPLPPHLRSPSQTNMRSVPQNQLLLHLLPSFIQSLDSWPAITRWSLLRSTSANFR